MAAAGAWAAQPRVVGGHCPPTFEAKRVQGGTMKMMYSSQFRLYSGVRRGSILFHLLSVLELPGGNFPHRGCEPPNNTRRRSRRLGVVPTAFFLVRPLFVIKYLY